MLARSIYAFIVIALAVFAAPAPSRAAEFACPSVLDHKFANLMDEPVSLCRFSGKVVLVVNTASECGYTPQYDGLEKLYRRYREKGFVVLGFPANDFGDQESGSNKEIAKFCQVNYDVTFPVFAKTSVIGANANPLYRALAAQELPQVPPRQGRAARSGVRKCRRAQGSAGYFADRQTARCTLIYNSRSIRSSRSE